MERIRTKFIIAVTNRLSAAADTNAKTELIEELSDNLYQRYLDLTAQGVGEEDAYRQALDDLGDVEELLAYLASLGPDEQIPPSQGPESRARSVADDFLRGLEGFLRETVSQAGDAVHQAGDIVRDVADRIKEKYPDGFKGRVSIHLDSDEPAQEGEGAKGWTFTAGYNKERGGFFCGDRQSRRVEGTAFPSGALRSIDVGMVNGDVTIKLDEDPGADVVLAGDAENLELRLSDDGSLLTIRQGNTASSSFFFGRGLAAADVELTIPRRAWELIKVETANGDVCIEDPGLEAGTLKVKAINGDLTLDGARCGLLQFRSASGDLRCDGFTGDVQVETASGDVLLDGGSFGKASVSSASGDITIGGQAREVSCVSMSGDVKLESFVTPERLSVSSKSGDCHVTLPQDTGFTLRYSTVSGELEGDFTLVGPIGAKSGEAIYLDGGGRTFSISTVSGDITLRQL